MSTLRCFFMINFIFIINILWLFTGSAQIARADDSTLVLLKIEGYQLSVKNMVSLTKNTSEMGEIYKFSRVNVKFPTQNGPDINKRFDLYYQKTTTTREADYDWLLVGSISEDDWRKTRKDKKYITIRVTADKNDNHQNYFDADVRCYIAKDLKMTSANHRVIKKSTRIIN